MQASTEKKTDITLTFTTLSANSADDNLMICLADLELASGQLMPWPVVRCRSVCPSLFTFSTSEPLLGLS